MLTPGRVKVLNRIVCHPAGVTELHDVEKKITTGVRIAMCMSVKEIPSSVYCMSTHNMKMVIPLRYRCFGF